jgi:hypothetical protein
MFEFRGLQTMFRIITTAAEASTASAIYQMSNPCIIHHS